MAPGLKDKVDQAKVTQALAKPTSNVLGIFQDPNIKTQLAAAARGTGLQPERLLAVALNECRINRDLLDCTRESFVGALVLAARLGLEVGGSLGHFYLVPFRNTSKGVREVTPILGYKGMIVLARRSGEISSIAARAVYSNDLFEWEYGLEDKLVHKPALGDRGTITAFYGIARFTNGGVQPLVMSKAEVDKFRNRSKAKDSGPWVSDYEPMGAKTVIRRMAAFLPLTTEASIAIAEDEERELGLTPEGVLDLDVLGFPNGGAKESKESKAPPPAAAEGGDGTSKEKPSDPPPSSAPADDPTKDPSAPGSILKDAPEAEDPGAAFRAKS